MEILSFDCVSCDEQVMWAHPTKIDMARIIRRHRDSGWKCVDLERPNIETRFGELDISFQGLCPDCVATMELDSERETT